MDFLCDYLGAEPTLAYLWELAYLSFRTYLGAEPTLAYLWEQAYLGAHMHTIRSKWKPVFS